MSTTSETNEEAAEKTWRQRIAEQVRRNCTPSADAYKAGGDTLIYAVADWIENPPDWSKLPDPEPAEPAVLTAADFEMKFDADHTFPFVESEDATIMAYGHPDPTELAARITEYDHLCAGPGRAREDWETDPRDIRQSYAIVIEGGEEWRIRWGQDADAEGAFPISVVSR